MIKSRINIMPYCICR